MTDSSPGPGWWLASDGNWYPPHLHPDARARAAAEAQAAAADAERTRPGDEHLGRAVVADHVARTTTGGAAPTDPTTAADLTRPFGRLSPDDDVTQVVGAIGGAGTSGAANAPRAADDPSSIDHIVASSAGGIDWEAVARERAAQREARNRQSATTRRKVVVAAAGGVVVLLVLWLLTRGGDDDSSRTVTTPATTTAAPSTTAAPTTTAAPSTTAAPTTTAAKPATGATGTGATGASTTKPPTTAAPTTAAPATTVAANPGTNVSVFSLSPGSCIDQENLTTGLVTTVRTVSCDQPHTHEVYLKTTVSPADATYDAAKVTAFANQACTDGFKAYVGIAYDQSKYYFLHLAPSAESWNKNKDRDVVCLLLLEGQKLTGSVKGKGE